MPGNSSAIPRPPFHSAEEGMNDLVFRDELASFLQSSVMLAQMDLSSSLSAFLEEDYFEPFQTSLPARSEEMGSSSLPLYFGWILPSQRGARQKRGLSFPRGKKKWLPTFKKDGGKLRKKGSFENYETLRRRSPAANRIKTSWPNVAKCEWKMLSERCCNFLKMNFWHSW